MSWFLRKYSEAYLMKGECYTYNLGSRIDLQKVAKKIPGLKWLDKEQTVLSSEMGQMRALVYGDGRMRLYMHEKSFEELREHLLTASAEIYALIEELRKVASVKRSSTDIIASGAQETVAGFDPGVRKTLGADVSVEALRLLVFSAYDVSGDFQAERMATQAGETLGRSFVAGREFKDAEQLLKGIVQYFDEHKFGKLVAVAPADSSKSATKDATLRVYECAFSAGMPPVNKRVCNFERGFLRGAFAKWKNTETVAVKETKCWGMGDAFCEFDIYTLSR